MLMSTGFGIVCTWCVRAIACVARRRPVFGGARHADVARALLPPGARLVDAADLCEARGRTACAEGRDDRGPIQALWRLGRPCVLALPHARLSRGRVAGLKMPRVSSSGS